MRTTLLLILLASFTIMRAQERCATQSYLSGVQAADPREAGRMQAAESFLSRQALLKQVAANSTIRIPVVVHVLTSGNIGDVPDAQIRSGIAALNRDFRRQNSDTINTPERFRNVAADVQIEFYLATADPNGRGTSGIQRRSTTRIGWMSDDRMKRSALGGIDAWDSRSYLNIWICNLVSGSGYATAPGSDPAVDGIVINAAAFGTINTATPFNMGRTAVHEAGHWLGLKHVWGDINCGDDGVDDTPQQSFYTKGCPVGIRTSCGNTSTGDMYMNYMDYTNDACMNLFTQGQKARMRAAFNEGGPRAALLQSKGLHEPWLAESPLPASTTSAVLYPNPTVDKFVLQVSEAMIGKTVFIVNSQGQNIRSERIVAAQQSFNVQSLKPGIYFLKVEGLLQKFLKL